jgi:uncharacterized membrane protein
VPLHIRRVTTARGWQWIVEAVALFRLNPLVWVFLTLGLLLLGLALASIPLVGSYLLYLLTPLFLAGLMSACKEQEAGGAVELAHLFRGFQHNASHLITVGGVYLVGQVLIFGAFISIGGPELAELLRTGASGVDPTKIPPESADRLSLAMLVSMGLLAALAMAVWFAPALVILDDVPALRALQLSVRACLRNALPFLLYGAVMLLLLVIATLPLFAGLVLWVPLAVISSYTSYKDVFARQLTQG